MAAKLTIGPVLFHWPADKKRDFYFKIADEAPVDTVYLGEVICSKRAPFFEDHYAEVSDRLTRGGKKVVFSTLAEVMLPRERKMTAALCVSTDFEIEANDTSALYHLRKKPHRIGQYFNVYNEETLAHLVKGGATHICLPAELPAPSINLLAKKAKALKINLEMQVYGRVGLALSARCYHARSHGRVKDNCQFVCEENPDGLDLKTLDGRNFLTINGIQTLSHPYLNLIAELKTLEKAGIGYFRLSPHDLDMTDVCKIFEGVLHGKTDPKTALESLGQKILWCNGFYHGREGYSWAA